jgi:hypothetical protein
VVLGLIQIIPNPGAVAEQVVSGRVIFTVLQFSCQEMAELELHPILQEPKLFTQAVGVLVVIIEAPV